MRAAGAPSRVRLLVLLLLAVGTLINYLDRTVLGIAAPALRGELGIDAVAMGVVFSAFSWTYAAAQIPGGLLLDRLGSRLTYALSVAAWSVFTLLHGLAGGVASLLLCRFGLGVSEAPCFPTNSRVVATWFPQGERARATSVYTVGEYLGLACFSPLLFALLARFGWRSLFVVTGIAGIAFAALWWRLYREPRESRANAAERALIEAGGGLTADVVRQEAFSWRQVRRLLGYRQVLGACLGQFGGNTTMVFFLTWFPTYLATERHMGWIRLGLFAVLPFLAAAVGVSFGGWLSDRLLVRTGSATLARKLPILAGLLGASTIVAANGMASDAAVIAVLSLAFFSQGMTGLGWTLISDVAPRHLMGLTGGIFNFAANLAGVLTPLVVGWVVARTGSFHLALAYVGAAALLGAGSYLFLLGEVRRLEDA